MIICVPVVRFCRFVCECVCVCVLCVCVREECDLCV